MMLSCSISLPQRAEKPRGVTTRVLNIIRFSVIKPLS
jgi:hypothetical protein